MLKQGVTYRHIARLFKDGMSVYELSELYWCDVEDIEAIIRAVMTREEKQR